MPTRRPHPLRTALDNEVHARPQQRMRAPLAVSHFASIGDANAREALAKGLYAAKLPAPVELVVAASVPVIAVSTWVGMHRLRRRIGG